MNLAPLPHGTLALSTPRQMAALASPLRVEIVENLRHAGHASVADLARLTGRSPTTLHYHVGLLLTAGLLVPAGRRRAGKRGEAVYTLAAERIVVVATLKNPASVRAAVAAVGATLRLAQREAARAMTSRRPCTAGPQRDLHVRRLRAVLPPKALARVNGALERIETIFRDELTRRARRTGRTAPTDPPACRTVSLTFVLAPAGARPGGTPAHRPSPPEKPR